VTKKIKLTLRLLCGLCTLRFYLELVTNNVLLLIIVFGLVIKIFFCHWFDAVHVSISQNYFVSTNELTMCSIDSKH